MNIERLQAPGPVAATPYDLVTADRPTRTARKSLVLGLCRHLEDLALHDADPPVVLATFQDERFFGPGTAARYARLATRCPLVGAIGVEPDARRPAPGVRCVGLAADDPLQAQWSMAVIGAHLAIALLALDLCDGGRDEDRRFTYTITSDRETAVAAGRSLLARFG